MSVPLCARRAVVCILSASLLLLGSAPATLAAGNQGRATHAIAGKSRAVHVNIKLTLGRHGNDPDTLSCSLGQQLTGEDVYSVDSSGHETYEYSDISVAGTTTCTSMPDGVTQAAIENVWNADTGGLVIPGPFNNCGTSYSCGSTASGSTGAGNYYGSYTASFQAPSGYAWSPPPPAGCILTDSNTTLSCSFNMPFSLP
jgi:hypothetical protein